MLAVVAQEPLFDGTPDLPTKSAGVHRIQLPKRIELALQERSVELRYAERPGAGRSRSGLWKMDHVPRAGRNSNRRREKELVHRASHRGRTPMRHAHERRPSSRALKFRREVSAPTA
jgi:hypothetical protein